MSVKIKVSYEYEEELEEVKKALHGLLINLKIRDPKGRYKRAYIDLKNLTKPDI